MKQLCIKLLMMAWVLCLSITAHAQEESTNQVTYTLDNVESTATFETGKLMEALRGEEQALKVTKIAINGTLNSKDVKTLRLMGGSNEKEEHTDKGMLQELDLSKTSFKVIDWPASIAEEDKEDEENPNTFLKTSKKDNLIDDNKDDKGNLVYIYGMVRENSINLPNLFFSNCDNLKKVTLNENTVTISPQVFRGCDNLEECTNLVSSNTAITTIGAGAFAYCKSLDFKDENGKLPQNLEKIDNGAFTHCCHQQEGKYIGITKVTIPASVTIIDMGAFSDCMAIKELYFDGSLTATAETDSNVKELRILNNAFSDCQNMVIQNEGQLPNRIVCINNLAFAHNLSPIIILPANPKLTGKPESNTSDVGNVGYGAFGWCDVGLKKLHIPENITYIQDNVFTSAKNLETIEFERPKNIKHIGGGAFSSNEKIENQFKDVDQVEFIGNNAFQNCFKLTDADAKALITNSKITEVNVETFANCSSLTEIDLNKNITTLKDWSFSNCTKLTKVTVHSAKITAYRYKFEKRWEYTDENKTQTREWYEYADKGAFNGINANQVEVVFEGDAETNYQNYRNTAIQSDNNINWTNAQGENFKGVEYKDNAFMNLLTKTMKETDTEYTVVPQRHADVKLYRNFIAGWNTLMLPFGAQNDETKGSVKGLNIFKNALNPSKEENSLMIAKYRGLLVKEAENKSTFHFLRVENEERLNEFEPIIVRMDAKDIEQAKANATSAGQTGQLYTFENVDVNYLQDTENKTYTAKTADEMTAAAVFDGNEDHDMNEKFKQCTYKDFNFVGTLVPKSGNDFITAGDYIIQNNNFVLCKDTKTYGLKGFRGFFKKKDDNNQAKGDLIMLNVVDENGGTTAITKIDGENLNVPSTTAIYNLSGQLVGTDASSLPKGIYISGGKKFIVK